MNCNLSYSVSMFALSSHFMTIERRSEMAVMTLVLKIIGCLSLIAAIMFLLIAPPYYLIKMVIQGLSSSKSVAQELPTPAVEERLD